MNVLRIIALIWSMYTLLVFIIESANNKNQTFAFFITILMNAIQIIALLSL